MKKLEKSIKSIILSKNCSIFKVIFTAVKVALTLTVITFHHYGGRFDSKLLFLGTFFIWPLFNYQKLGYQDKNSPLSSWRLFFLLLSSGTTICSSTFLESNFSKFWRFLIFQINFLTILVFESLSISLAKWFWSKKSEQSSHFLYL